MDFRKFQFENFIAHPYSVHKMIVKLVQEVCKALSPCSESEYLDAKKNQLECVEEAKERFEHMTLTSAGGYKV